MNLYNYSIEFEAIFFITASIYKCTHQNRIASMLFPKGTEKLKASSITNLIRQAQKERRRNEGQMSVMKQRQWSDEVMERERGAQWSTGHVPHLGIAQDSKTVISWLQKNQSKTSIDASNNHASSCICTLHEVRWSMYRSIGVHTWIH